MKLSLSSAAAPDATLTDLLVACRRRGLAAVELVDGGAHGVSVHGGDMGLEAARGLASSAAIGIAGVYCDAIDAGDLEAAAQLGLGLGAPVVVPADALPADLLPGAARAFSAAGATLLLSHGSNPSRVARLRNSLATLADDGAIGLAWEVRPGQDDLSRAGEVLDAAEGKVRYLRLHGGGPEAAQQAGFGIGALMARLALASWTGPLLLTPSTHLYRRVWQAWLGRAGGWGCGSRQADSSLVNLDFGDPPTGSAA